MVYAMMSIGVLGFVVWSQWLAFLIGNYKVINSTVGWNGYLFLFLFTITSIWILCNTKLGNLLDTFCSLNANKNAQSAGNLCLISHLLCVAKQGKKGSSETIRGNTYDLFKQNFSCFFKQEFTKDNNWLSWFIGFLEGDGAILEHKGRSYFVLTQKDDTVLHEIYETLKIGKVKQFYDNKGNKKYSRYIVSENKGIFLLYLLLNGNLVLKSRVKQLTKWNVALNNAIRFDYSVFYSKKVPNKIENLKEPSLDDGWLSGFTDAEGCFSVKIKSIPRRGSAKTHSNYVELLFILDQKKEEKSLNKIAILFDENENKKAIIRTPNIKKVSSTNNIKSSEEVGQMFRLTFYCNDKKRVISSKIVNYFNRYNLKTSKKKSFQIWTEILDLVLNNNYRSEQEINYIRKLRHNINFFTIENQPTGYAIKS